MQKQEFSEMAVMIMCQKFHSGREKADVGIHIHRMLASSVFIIREVALIQMKHQRNAL